MILKQTIRKARKEHICDCCKTKINYRDKYLAMSILDKNNDCVYSVKYCYTCRDMRYHIPDDCWECPYLHSNSPSKNYLNCDIEDC